MKVDNVTFVEVAVKGMTKSLLMRTLKSCGRN